MDENKTGIYTLSGSRGNLKNMVDGEVIVTEEIAEEIEDEIQEYMKKRVSRVRKEQYCIVRKERVETSI